MNDFVKMVLAVLCGLVLMSILSLILTFGFLGSLSAAGNAKPVLPREGVLKLDMSSILITEQAESVPNPMGMLQSVDITPVGIWDAVQAINKAASDPSVSLLYIKTDGLSASLTGVEELRAAIERFRQGGKAVIAYTENPSSGSYYLASAADKVFMSSVCGASPMITGIGSQMIYLKDILDKLGVNVQLIRHGKYKSAGEPYIRNTPSKENLEQNQSMINSIWKTMASDVEASRGIEEGSYSRMIDNLELLNAEDMVRAGLVDEVLSKEELRGRIATLAGKEAFSDVTFIPFADYVKANFPAKAKGKDKIAIVYATGEIVEGPGQPGQIAGDKFSSMLTKIRNDKDVKAVVFRVASPGGSVTASDKIKQEIDLLRAEKPVVASYGDYAASGGYWISNSCDKIFTDRTTLTGSIGVFSMIPDLSKTAKDILHVNVVSVGSSKHSDIFSLMRPLDADETAFMQASVEDIYSRFVGTVAQGRDLTEDYVDSIAQGRVWTGSQSIELGLTDAIGTLEDAVRYAATLAGQGDDTLGWNIVSYPEPLSPLESILEMIQGARDDKDVLADTPFKGIGKAFLGWDEHSERVYARMPYEFIIK